MPCAERLSGLEMPGAIRRAEALRISQNADIETSGTGFPQPRTGQKHQASASPSYLCLFDSICGNRLVFFDRDALSSSRILHF